MSNKVEDLWEKVANSETTFREFNNKLKTELGSLPGIETNFVDSAERSTNELIELAKTVLQQNENIRQDNEEFKTENHNIRVEKEDLDTQKKTAEKGLREAQQQFNKDNLAKDKDIAALQGLNEQLKEENKKLEAEKTKAQNEKEMLESVTAEAVDAREEIQTELKKAKEERDAARKKSEVLSESIEKATAEAKETIGKFNDEVDRLRKENAALKKEKAARELEKEDKKDEDKYRQEHNINASPSSSTRQERNLADDLKGFEDSENDDGENGDRHTDEEPEESEDRDNGIGEKSAQSEETSSIDSLGSDDEGVPLSDEKAADAINRFEEQLESLRQFLQPRLKEEAGKDMRRKIRTLRRDMEQTRKGLDKYINNLKKDVEKLAPGYEANSTNAEELKNIQAVVENMKRRLDDLVPKSEEQQEDQEPQLPDTELILAQDDGTPYPESEVIDNLRAIWKQASDLITKKKPFRSLNEEIEDVEEHLRQRQHTLEQNQQGQDEAQDRPEDQPEDQPRDEHQDRDETNPTPPPSANQAEIQLLVQSYQRYIWALASSIFLFLLVTVAEGYKYAMWRSSNDITRAIYVNDWYYTCVGLPHLGFVWRLLWGW